MLVHDYDSCRAARPLPRPGTGHPPVWRIIVRCVILRVSMILPVMVRCVILGTIVATRCVILEVSIVVAARCKSPGPQIAPPSLPAPSTKQLSANTRTTTAAMKSSRCRIINGVCASKALWSGLRPILAFTPTKLGHHVTVEELCIVSSTPVSQPGGSS